MTKQQFLRELEKALQKIPKMDREEILQDFEEHFAIGIAEDKSEQQIIASLGSPQQIAKEMRLSSGFEQAKSKVTNGTMVRAIWAAIGVIFFNFVIVLGPFIAVVGLVLSGWVLSISLISTPILLLINVILSPNSFELFEFFLTIGFCGLGIFVAMGMYLVTKGIVRGTMKYIHFNINLVNGGLQA